MSRTPRIGTCSVCDQPIEGRGLCRTHYRRLLRYGDPLVSGRPKRTMAEIFASYMPGEPPTSECWDWTGGIHIQTGYGRLVMTNRKAILAHRASHLIYNAHDPITEQKPFVLHSCDRPICVNPNHLRAGNNADNVQDAIDRGRQSPHIRPAAHKLST